MGTQLGPALANVFLFHFEEQWISACSINFINVFHIEGMLTINFCYSRLNRT